MFTCAKILKLIIYDICDVTLSVYPHWASLKNMPGHGWNRTYDLIYVSQRLFINLVVQRHACIVFLPNPPIAMFESRIAEEVGQPIRRTSRPIRLRHFPHARTKLLVSKIYIGLINIDFFHIVMHIF
jgi:hypothetical protein